MNGYLNLIIRYFKWNTVSLKIPDICRDYFWQECKLNVPERYNIPDHSYAFMLAPHKWTCGMIDHQYGIQLL